MRTYCRTGVTPAAKPSKAIVTSIEARFFDKPKATIQLENTSKERMIAGFRPTLSDAWPQKGAVMQEVMDESDEQNPTQYGVSTSLTLQLTSNDG